MDNPLVTGLAAASALYLSWFVARQLNTSDEERKVDYVVTTSDCDRAIEIIRRHMSTFPVLGLDCEWGPDFGTRNEVQVISLATLEGYRAVLQISRFSVPTSLRNLLEDEGIFKVGVGIQNDQQHLASTGLELNKWVDIRHLDKTSDPDKSLKGMTLKVLGENLNKKMKRSGNWGGHLTEGQIQYAAKDADVGVRICKVLLDGRHALHELRQFAERPYPLPKRSMFQ